MPIKAVGSPLRILGTSWRGSDRRFYAGAARGTFRVKRPIAALGAGAGSHPLGSN
jgi:hypothetical protein